MLKTYNLYTRATDKIRPNELVDTTQAHNKDEAIYNFEAKWHGKYVIRLQGGKSGYTVILEKRYPQPLKIQKAKKIKILRKEV